LHGAPTGNCGGKHEYQSEACPAVGVQSLASTDSQESRLPVTGCAGQVDADLSRSAGKSRPPLRRGWKMLRKGGRIGDPWLTGAEKLTVPWIEVVFGELSLIGVMGYGTFDGEGRDAAGIGPHAGGRVALEPMITLAVQLQTWIRALKQC